MLVAVTFHTTTRDAYGTWSNIGVDDLLKDFPGLSSLASSLVGESEWSESQGRFKWSALFLVKYDGSKKTVSLEMKSSLYGVFVPSLRINPEKPPTLREVQSHILRNLGEMPLETLVLDEEDPEDGSAKKPVLM